MAVVNTGYASLSITNLDSMPTVYPTRGQGGPVGSDGLYSVSDYISITAAQLVAAQTGMTFRLVRFPVEAMIQKVEIASDSYLDGNNSPTLALDFNIAFSDANTSSVGATANAGLLGNSIQDGTSTVNAGQVPTSALTGAITPVATYTSPNILFGTYTVQSHTAGIPWTTDITLPGAVGLASNNYTLAMMQEPLWYALGFTNGNLPTGTNGPGIGGFFDLTAYVSVASATGHAAKLWAKVTYCLA